MNKTIYVRDEDSAIWDRAKELTGEKLAPVIMEQLKRFVSDKEAELKGFERIEVRFNDWQDNRIPKAKAFYGKWIFGPDNPLKMDHRDGPDETIFWVAITAKGAAVVYSWEDSFEHGTTCHQFRVFSSFQEAATDKASNWAVTEAWKVIGVPVEELDI